jgi:hypothetical protein
MTNSDLRSIIVPLVVTIGVGAPCGADCSRPGDCLGLGTAWSLDPCSPQAPLHPIDEPSGLVRCSLFVLTEIRCADPKAQTD